MDLMQLLARVLNPNPGVVNQMTGQMTGLGPEQLARYHQQSGMGAPANMLTSSTDAGAPVPSFMAPQEPIAPQMAPQAQPQPARAGGGLGGFVSNLFQSPETKGRNQVMQWLQGQGLDEGTAAVLASDKQSLQQYLRDKMKGGGGSEFDQRAVAARKYGLDPTSPEGRAYILSGDLPEARGGAAEMSLNTIPGVNEKGEAVLIQVDKAGTGHQTALPPGVKIAKPPMIKDTGTEYQVIDPITREVVQSIPKNVAGAAAQRALGTAQGEAQFDLPRVEQNAAQTLDILDRMERHPGRKGSTGFIQGMLPSRTSDQVDFQSLVSQTQGQAFLQAFQMLKGGGQITEVEGQKATDAISRLRNQRLSDKDYLQPIADLKGVINTGLERARRQAGLPPAPLKAPPSAQGFTQDTDTSKGDRVIKSVKDLSDEELEAIINGQ